ncbi:MAG: hypothetical protein ACLP6E_07735, partial [Acidimicrobiales bacterium]
MSDSSCVSDTGPASRLGTFRGVPAEGQVSRTMPGSGVRFKSRFFYLRTTVVAAPVGSGVDAVKRRLDLRETGCDLVQQ